MFRISNNENRIAWTIYQVCAKCLISNDIKIIARQHQSDARPYSQRENAVSGGLSTKLSPACVDKSRKSLVYRDLADFLMFYINSLLHCMIFLYCINDTLVLARVNIRHVNEGRRHEAIQ
jgi:hypothetical protein